MPSGYFRPYCSACRTKGETQHICSKCGKKRDGSHASYCRSCYQEYDRNRDKRDRELKRIYGITVENWEEMLANQNGCAACSGLPNGRGRYHVDHDHKTGKVRGLLCASCNSSIAHSGDSPAQLRLWADELQDEARRYDDMAAYLERSA